ncbi:hypothetical protein G6700_05165 [Polynucleobacter paneuropaeus]|nr:hypothetical protein G6700_05165 [Polynucleobacter paneuropaeus]
MVIVVVANRQGHIFGFTLTDIAQFDFSFRFTRGSLFVFLQLLILMHWMEHFSENAIKVKIRDEKIQNLLLEKDILIENLSNKNALVETGALSAGLAHEFNQFLARIELNSDEVIDKINRPDVNLEDLTVARAIEQDTNAMQELIRKSQLSEALKTLSPRERQVFELLAKGYGNKELVDELGIALSTAKEYKSDVMYKLRLRSLAELIALNTKLALS